MQLKTIRVDIFYKSGTLKNTKLLVKSGKAGAERFVKQCGVDLGDIVKHGSGSDREYWYNCHD